ncbi:MAG: hypothetical protein JO290_05785 [Sphingomonadaceae bacterium]|nr:hypothetical protein [Sphingomonadaceae bacterium]
MRVLFWIVLALVVLLITGVVYLMTADVPAPTHHVEQVIPNDRLGR